MKNFVLLSAYCCGKPLLQFQHAKLKLEEAIRTSPITHSIVRPTAFFKSIDGQLESARNGNPIFLYLFEMRRLSSEKNEDVFNGFFNGFSASQNKNHFFLFSIWLALKQAISLMITR